jgi:hypothetical protein
MIKYVALVTDEATQILMNHMKRAKEEYTTATNGLEALHKYQAEHQNIKVIFMGMRLLSSAVLRFRPVLLMGFLDRVFPWTSTLSQS